MKELTLQLFDYHFWANEKLLQHLQGLPKGIYLSKVESVFPSIAETFGHMVAADEVWYSRLKGESLSQLATKKFRSIEETSIVSAALYNEIKHFLTKTENFERMIHYNNMKGDPFNNKMSEIVHHMVNHGTYHRGNISAMIRQMGFEGISTDYIVYLRIKHNQVMP
ncbi:hypothetical protein WQ54_20865 [Bacillus sp. SA1-12]|uniref:DinB family protein n=1 Tax=Bacillus sp. SA1-12 TaxID=1455638 RepID=UPI0006272287|nr:DinB family protein [Bacillus sp. SA1-12]KKI90413.1 hypothetical protein WQ54_20865 [Bacillus sp. SA1-12]